MCYSTCVYENDTGKEVMEQPDGISSLVEKHELEARSARLRAVPPEEW